ncbi:MAG: DnaB-like helicase C-terminal domain-containing protein, partial [Psittacicella sp.]
MNTSVATNINNNMLDANTSIITRFSSKKYCNRTYTTQFENILKSRGFENCTIDDLRDDEGWKLYIEDTDNDIKHQFIEICYKNLQDEVHYCQNNLDLHANSKLAKYIHEKSKSITLFKTPGFDEKIKSCGGIVLACEGPYDALSLDFSTQYPVVAAQGLSSMKNLKELESVGAKTVYWIADKDNNEQVVELAKNSIKKLNDIDNKAGVNYIYILPSSFKTSPVVIKDSNDYFKEFGSNGLNIAIESSIGDYNQNLEIEQLMLEGLTEFNFKDDYLSMLSNPAPQIKSGIETIDNMLDGGFTQGQVVYIAGQTGVGKTAFMLQLAYSMSHKYTALYVSLEMSKPELITRNIVRESKEDIKYKEVLQNQHPEAVNNYFNNQSLRNIYYLESKEFGGISTTDITKKLDSIKSLKGINTKFVIFIDYLQILKASRDSKFDKEKIDLLVGELKTIANTYNATVFVVTSINRSSYQEKKITLGSLKESGGIEYGADLVIALNYNRLEGSIDSSYRKIKVEILKARCLVNRYEELLSFEPSKFKYSKYDEAGNSSSSK